MPNPRLIVLIGLKHSGKSTVAKALSHIGYQARSLDSDVADAFGYENAADTYRAVGRRRFRSAEYALLSDYLSPVVARGRRGAGLVDAGGTKPNSAKLNGVAALRGRRNAGLVDAGGAKPNGAGALRGRRDAGLAEAGSDAATESGSSTSSVACVLDCGGGIVSYGPTRRLLQSFSAVAMQSAVVGDHNRDSGAALVYLQADPQILFDRFADSPAFLSASKTRARVQWKRIATRRARQYAALRPVVIDTDQFLPLLDDQRALATLLLQRVREGSRGTATADGSSGASADGRHQRGPLLKRIRESAHGRRD